MTTTTRLRFGSCDRRNLLPGHLRPEREAKARQSGRALQQIAIASNRWSCDCSWSLYAFRPPSVRFAGEQHERDNPHWTHHGSAERIVESDNMGLAIDEHGRIAWKRRASKSGSKPVPFTSAMSPSVHMLGIRNSSPNPALNTSGPGGGAGRRQRLSPTIGVMQWPTSSKSDLAFRNRQAEQRATWSGRQGASKSDTADSLRTGCGTQGISIASQGS